MTKQLYAGRRRRFEGLDFYEAGQFNSRRRAQKAADSYRQNYYKARVVPVKSALVHGKHYPWHIFIRGRG